MLAKTLLKNILAVVYLLVTGYSSNLFAGQIYNSSDLTNPTTQTYLNPTYIHYNETPFVIGGDTYVTDSGTIQWGTMCGMDTGCISTTTDNGFIDITLGNPAIRAGIFASGMSYALFWTINADFYGVDGNLLGTSSVRDVSYAPLYNQPPTFRFLGFEATNEQLISRIRVTDAQNNGFSMTLDNLMVENITPVSETNPSIMLLIGLGLLSFMFRKRLSV